MITEQITVRRGATDAMSERANTTHTVQGIFAWSRHTDDTDRRESASTTVQLYVRRGADIQARDRLTRTNGEAYRVVGHSMWDQASPYTGKDFGWKVFQLESMTG